jgi:hypothetical protein
VVSVPPLGAGTGGEEDMEHELMDRLLVVEALAHFHHAADSNDWAVLRTLVTDDVRWSWRGEDASGVATDAAEGADAVVGWVRAAMTGSTVRHYTTSHVVSTGGDRASAQSYLLTVDTTSLHTLASGTVRSTFRRAGNRWLVSSIAIDERIPDGSVAALLARVDNA